MNPYEITQILGDKGLRVGSMISHSKSSYLDNHVGHEVYFNANIYVGGEKIWWGDIDLTISGHVLQGIADDCDMTIYVLSEFDGRLLTKPDQIAKLAKKTYAPPVNKKQSIVSKLLSTKILSQTLSAIRKASR